MKSEATTSPTARKAARKQSRRSSTSPRYLSWDLPTAAQNIAQGLPARSLDDVRRELDLTNQEFAEVIHVSVRTLTRRRSEKTLPPDESERVYRVGRLLEFAARVLGGQDAAKAWMKESNYALGGSTPLDYAKTEPGAALVERILGQIAHGISV